MDLATLHKLHKEAEQKYHHFCKQVQTPLTSSLKVQWFNNCNWLWEEIEKVTNGLE